jgi:SSS family solute:Na+ symporter
MITIDYLIVAAFIGGMLLVSVWASRKVKGADDFAIAGGRLPFPFLTGTIIASVIGAIATFGRAGKAYEVGVVIIVSAIAYALGLVVFGFLVGKLKKEGVWSVPTLLRQRFGKPLQLIAGLVLFVAVVAVYGAQLIATGRLVSAFGGGFGITYGDAVVGAGVVLTLYTLFGGMFAVAFTDLIQAVIMLVIVGLVMPVLVMTQTPDALPILMAEWSSEASWIGGLSIAYIASFFLIDIPFCLIDPSLWQRSASSSSTRDVRRAMWIAAAVFVLWSAVTVSLGLLARHIFVDVSSDAIITELAVRYLPPVALGLCIAALLAVLMSTADTVLLIAGTTIAFDVSPHFAPKMSDPGRLMTMRAVVLLVGAGGIVLAMKMSGIFDIMLIAFAIFVSALFLPTMAALFWKRTSGVAATWSAVLASISVVALYVVKLNGQLPEAVEPIFVSLAVSATVLVVLTLMIPRRVREDAGV